MVDLSPQQLEIYLLLKERVGGEVHISEITNDRPLGGLGIKGYSERISELRKKGFNVHNTRKNHYMLLSEPDMGINSLRILYSEAKKRNYKSLMQRIVTRAESLKLETMVQESLA